MTTCVCPQCNFKSNIQLFLKDAESRQFCSILIKMHPPVQKVCIQYLGLFNSRKTHSMSWPKAIRLLEELNKEVSNGYVKKKGKVDRSTTPEIWGQAMEKMIDWPPESLPLSNHNYLKSVVWSLANEQDKIKEKQVVEHERFRHIQNDRPKDKLKITPDMFKKLRNKIG